MPTLLQINISANSGSTGRIAEEIGERAIAAGWRSIIAYGRAARPSKNELLKFGSKASFMMHCVESLLFDNHGLGSRLATRTLIRKIEEIKPDVIQLHNIHGYYVSYRLLFDYLNKKNIPVVWTLHDCWSFTGHCSHFISANCEKWKTHCHNCPKIKYYPQSLIDRSSRNYELKKALFTANSNLTAVPVCQWLADLVKQSFLKNADIEVIRNGVDLNVFTPKPRTNDGMVRVLGVSNVWQEAKGLCDFYDLREMLNPEQFEIILVGLTEEQIKQLPKGIKGITRTSSVEELVNYYSNADVFVNPTYADTFPTTNIEALACGTPVITYNIGGSPEAIDETTGIVIPKGDKESLKNAIIEVVTNKDKYSSEACRQRAVAHFNKDDRFGDYIGLFNKILRK